MQKLDNILKENGLTREKIIDIVLDAEFDMEWNNERGKKFRKAVVDLVYIEEKHTNDSWIPTKDRLPKKKTEFTM